MAGRLKSGLAYSFGPLLKDIGVYLLIGIAAAGVIAWLVPDGFIEQHLGAGIMPMLVMLVVGVPLYVCATASTPVVAALALKGLSPGAALVFLMAGPATNAATLTVIARLMGKRVAVVYVSVIAACSLALGIGVNYLYGCFAISISGWVAAAQHAQHGGFASASAVVLLALIAKAHISGR